MTGETVELRAGHWRLALRAVNTAAQPVERDRLPCLAQRPRSRLHAEPTHRRERDATTQLPTRRVVQPGIDAAVAHLDFDHGFDGWQRAARIRDEKLALRPSSPLDRLVVRTPPQQDCLCVEPVRHVGHAIHTADPLAHGWRALDAGDAFEAWMKPEVARS